MRKLLTLFAAIAIIIVLTGCGKAEKSNLEYLTSTEWTLDEIVYDGNDFTLTPPDNVTIIFSDSGKVSGRGSCNRFFGNYTAADSTISLSPLASTEMFCPDMDFETSYFRLLGSVDGFRAKEHTLTLRSAAEGTELVFKPMFKAVE